METCIYLRESQKTLSYNNKEHVIPAGLGGIATLPKGAVSDEANHLFSNRERIALRETFLSVNRRNNGPGKRGSGKVHDSSNPDILVFEGVADADKSRADLSVMPLRIGFLFYGMVYIIPQMYVEIREDQSVQIPIVTIGSNPTNPVAEYLDFNTTVFGFLCKPNKQKQDYRIVRTRIESARSYILIGLYHSKLYINSSYPDSVLEKILMLFENKSPPEKHILLQEFDTTWRYMSDLPKAFDEAFNFIYVKTAFNALTYLTGSRFVNQSQFDEIRQSIVLGKQLERFIINDQLLPNWLSPWVMENVPAKSHLVILYGHGNYIEAYVSFYKELPIYPIRLSKEYSGEEFRKYFYCNYLAREEKSGIIGF